MCHSRLVFAYFLSGWSVHWCKWSNVTDVYNFMSSNFTEFVSSDSFSVEILYFSVYIMSSASSDSSTSYFVIYIPFGASLVAQLVKNLLQCRRPGFDPWVRKIPCRRKWQPTPGPLPGEFHGQRSWAGYSPWDLQELDRLCDFHFHIFFIPFLFLS